MISGYKMAKRKEKKQNNPNWKKVNGEWIAVPKGEQGISKKK